MSQTLSQDPVDLVQTHNATGHDTINTEHTPSPKHTSIQEDPPTSYQPQTVAQEPLEDSSTQPRSSSLPAPSSKTDISSEALVSTNVIPNEPNLQTDQAQLPQEDLGSSKDPLEAYDWTALEERFQAELEKCADREYGIQEEFDELLKVNLFLPTSCSALYTRRGVSMMTPYILTNTRSSKHGQPPAQCRKKRGRESGMSTPLYSKNFIHHYRTTNNPKPTNPHGLCTAQREDPRGEADAL